MKVKPYLSQVPKNGFFKEFCPTSGHRSIEHILAENNVFKVYDTCGEEKKIGNSKIDHVFEKKSKNEDRRIRYCIESKSKRDIETTKGQERAKKQIEDMEKSKSCNVFGLSVAAEDGTGIIIEADKAETLKKNLLKSSKYIDKCREEKGVGETCKIELFTDKRLFKHGEIIAI